MKNIIAFAGSTSKDSINKKLVVYTSNKIELYTTEVLDLNDFMAPLYSIDIEQEHGIPHAAQLLLQKIKAANGIILSLAEHNGAYTAAFKNIFDWMSRIDGKLWNNTPMLLMATSPGARGGASVLDIASKRFPYMGGNIVSSFSLPNFYDNFNNGEITNEDFVSAHTKAVAFFITKLN